MTQAELRLRRDLERLLDAALRAAEPGRLVTRALCSPSPDGHAPARDLRAEWDAFVSGSHGQAPPIILGFGKAAIGMARGALRAWKMTATAPPIAVVSGSTETVPGLRGLLVIPTDPNDAAERGTSQPAVPTRAAAAATPPATPAATPAAKEPLAWQSDREGRDRADLAPILVLRGDHPIPDEASVAAGRALLREARRASRERTPVLALISGGASALATLPVEGVALASLQAVTRGLLEHGADIHELNCVRKHLDRIKGGGLARILAPAPVLGLVISDVVGDPLDTIASGPLSPDATTFADAIAIIQRHDLWSQAPDDVRTHLERGAAETGGNIRSVAKAPDDPCFESVRLHLIASGLTVARAVATRARELGYTAEIASTALTGEAREAGRALADRAVHLRQARRDSPRCLLFTGETTVTVRGRGNGGRNQELALSAARTLAGTEGILLAAFATDGIDGPTPAAGAIATGSTAERAADAGISLEAHLVENDSYPVFRALNDHILTGPTGTNMMDLQIVLIAR